MCLSPHEMTDAQVEYEIDQLQKHADNPRYSDFVRGFYETRAARLRTYLEDRQKKADQDQAFATYVNGAGLLPT